jgi:hypothetical protein
MKFSKIADDGGSLMKLAKRLSTRQPLIEWATTLP